MRSRAPPAPRSRARPTVVSTTIADRAGEPREHRDRRPRADRRPPRPPRRGDRAARGREDDERVRVGRDRDAERAARAARAQRHAKTTSGNPRDVGHRAEQPDAGASEARDDPEAVDDRGRCLRGRSLQRRSRRLRWTARAGGAGRAAGTVVRPAGARSIATWPVRPGARAEEARRSWAPARRRRDARWRRRGFSRLHPTGAGVGGWRRGRVCGR